MKQLEIQSLENQLVSEKQKLDKLKHTKPVAKQPETPVTPEPQPDTQPAAPEQKPDEQHDVISDLSEAKEAVQRMILCIYMHRGFICSRIAFEYTC